jgi:ubiquinone/menaquinone biosynthesis C-methylase UbiE
MADVAIPKATEILQSSTSFHSQGSSTYERMAMGCTGHVAQQMISILSRQIPLSRSTVSSLYDIPPITPNSYVLDNACGTGLVTQFLKESYPDTKILATDLTPQMLKETDEKTAKKGWKNVRTEIRDVKDLGDAGIEEGGFTHALTNFGAIGADGGNGAIIACKEIHRVLRPGGIAMFSTWADRVWPDAFLRVQKMVRPDVEPRHAMEIPLQCFRGSWIAAVMEDAGFGDQVAVIPVQTWVEAMSMEEMIENFFLAKMMMLPGFNDEEILHAKGLMGDEIKRLDTYQEVDGVVRIMMKAWIAIGWKVQP